MNKLQLLLSVALTIASTACAAPNIVFILADDLGYGDLSCYGQQKFRTRHIDEMAQRGIRLTQHYAGSTVCAPSRCVLMTGRHVGHAEVRGNSAHSPTSERPLSEDCVTLPRLLAKAGYDTALFGKWGLGDQHTSGNPQLQGFDYAFGYLSQSHAHNYWPEYLFRNGERVYLGNFVPSPRGAGAGVATRKVNYSHDLIEEEALAWIEQHRHRPFFVYLAVTLPHANNEAGSKGNEIPDLGKFVSEDWREPEKAKAAMITRLDETVGRVNAKLVELKLSDSTLVVFTSDNGPHAEGGNDPEFFHSSGGLRGIKRDLYEGGIRVPCIVRLGQSVREVHQALGGAIQDPVSGFQDWLPTFCQLAGIDCPEDADGVSLASQDAYDLLRKRYLYWEFYEQDGKQAVRWGNWKGVRVGLNTNPDAIWELYDLKTDRAETRNIAAQHADVVAQIASYANEAHTDHELWKWATSKGK